VIYSIPARAIVGENRLMNFDRSAKSVSMVVPLEPEAAGTAPSTTPQVWGRSRWTESAEQHRIAVERLTADHRSRTADKRSHPVEDFLFTYYSLRPAQLRRWHPGAGIGILEAPERAGWRFYRTVPAGNDPVNTMSAAEATGASEVTVVDHAQFWIERQQSIRFISDLLRRTAGATPQFGCFGLHEWAMVFEQQERRHDSWPLRLGQAATDDVVRAHQIRCSHFDAYRFFTPTAKPRNLLIPDLGSRAEMEQPGCLHASMDLYKWAYRLLPVISSDTVLECFRLARTIREVDMRASPYDLSELGYRPIRIETPEGKAEYVAEQRQFAITGRHLREKLLAELDAAFDSVLDPTAS